MTKLYIYEDGAGEPATLIVTGTTRRVYYMAMSYARLCKRWDGDVPYMRCTDPKINYLLTCKRMLVNFGFAE